MASIVRTDLSCAGKPRNACRPLPHLSRESIVSIEFIGVQMTYDVVMDEPHNLIANGVATSNSILVISFAREQLEETVGDAKAAALSAGYVRFRPVLMTALAMIIGMIPMALGLGDGGEQNAPLGRAVIGGLLFATVSTLFFVPTFFSVLHGRIEKRRREREARQKHQHAAPSEI